MAQRPLIRGCVAVAASFVVISGLACVAAPVAVANAPTETVIPAALSEIPRTDLVDFAGPGGFLHKQQGQSGFVWTKYSGGPDMPVSADFSNVPGKYGAGADIVATASGSTVQLQDMDAGTTAVITLPSGQTYLGTFGSRVLTLAGSGATSASLHILSLSGGQQTDTQVTGWPAGATVGTTVLAGDSESVLVRYTDNAGDRLAVLDLSTAQVTPVFSALPAATTISGVASATYVGWYTYTANQPVTLHLLPRSDLTAAETAVQVPLPPKVPHGFQVVSPQLALVGDTVLVNYQEAHTGSPTLEDLAGYPLYSMPLSGSSLSAVLAHVDSRSLRSTPNGIVVPGGPSATDWAARQVTADSTGALATASEDSDPALPAPIDGLALTAGQLYTLERNDGPPSFIDTAYLRSVQLGGTTPTYGAHMYDGQRIAPSNCDTAPGCEPPMEAANGTIMQLWPNYDSSGDAVAIEQVGAGGAVFTPQATGGSLVDSDGRYVVYDGGSTGKQYIIDTKIETQANLLYTRPVTGAALSAGALWVTGSTPGSINAVDPATERNEQTVVTGASCAPTELQAAAGRWLYWSCGVSGPAGVVDIATGAQMSVPTGLAQLGDGFVVTHDTAAGKLVLTDVHTDSAVTSDLAALPAGPVPDDRRVRWAVDRASNGITYLDAQQNIHLIDPHIPTSPAIPAESTSLLPGERLVAGDSLSSANMTLLMQSDGNLVAYLNTGALQHGPAIWASGTGGNPGAYAEMQPDGNLVVYRAGGGPSTGGALWSSGTYGHSGAYTTLQDDGNLVVYKSTGGPTTGGALWSDGTYARSQIIGSGQKLRPGWWTQAQYTRLVMQLDGNLVMYRKHDGAAIWSSRTSGHSGAYLYMQTDGNLVVYSSGGSPNAGGALWSSGTYGHSGAYAIMQDDGNLVVYKSGGGPNAGGSLWDSNTYHYVP